MSKVAKLIQEAVLSGEITEQEAAAAIAEARAGRLQKEKEEIRKGIEEINAIAERIGIKVSVREPRIGPVPVKYADGKGNTWTGRGVKPNWLKDALAKGNSLDDFKVAS